jgi:hypothetical protein
MTLNLSTVFFHPWGYVLRYLYVLQYLQFVGDFRCKILVSGYFLCRQKVACRPKFANFLTRRRRVANMSPTLPAKVGSNLMAVTFGLERLLEDEITISVEGDHGALVP